MNKNDELKLELLSSINDEIVDKHTKTRAALLENPRKSGFDRRILVRYGSLAAALLLVFAAVLTAFLMNRIPTPIPPDNPPAGTTSADTIPQNPTKQVPVYQGMTVSYTAPTSDELKGAAVINLSAGMPARSPAINLSGEATLGTASSSTPEATLGAASSNTPEATFGTASSSTPEATFGTPSIENAVKDELLSVSVAEMYYAQPGEDIYINIHLTNPDDFEIISFTLNGVTYQSFMFEDGSNLEHLILKYNVGAAEGIIEYTLDAIKYIDGTVIKDVLLEGNKTVKVAVTPTEPETLIASESVDFDCIELSLSLGEISSLLGANGFKTYALLLESGEIISKVELTETSQNVTFDSLRPNAEYSYAIAVTHGEDSDVSSVEVIYTKSFTTVSPVSIEGIGIEKTDVVFSAVWNESFDGERVFTSLELYEGEALVRTLGVGDTRIEGLPFDHTYSLVAKYTFKNVEHTYRINIDSPASSKGLAVVGGVVVGIGTNSDTVLYIDMPVGESAFFENKYIQAVYFGSGATYVGKLAFFNCPELREVIFPEGGTDIGDEAFSSCTKLESVTSAGDTAYGAFCGCVNLKSITFSDKTESIGESAFTNCKSLTDIDLSRFTRIENYTFCSCKQLKSVDLSSATYIGDFAFCECKSLTSVDLSSATYIGEKAFYDCSLLEQVTIDESKLKVVDAFAFSGTALPTTTIYEEGQYEEHYMELASNPYFLCVAYYNLSPDHTPAFHEDTRFIVGDVQTHGARQIILPDGLLGIGSDSFAETDVISITIPESVVYIGRCAFGICFRLRTVEFKSSTELYISEGAFECSYNLSKVTFENNPKLIIDNEAFMDINDTVHPHEIYLPENTEYIYPNAFLGSNTLTVYVGADSIPDCPDDWTAHVKEVVWGYKGEE